MAVKKVVACEGTPSDKTPEQYWPGRVTLTLETGEDLAVKGAPPDHKQRTDPRIKIHTGGPFPLVISKKRWALIKKAIPAIDALFAETD